MSDKGKDQEPERITVLAKEFLNNRDEARPIFTMEEQRDVDPFGCEPVGVARAVAL